MPTYPVTDILAYRILWFVHVDRKTFVINQVILVILATMLGQNDAMFTTKTPKSTTYETSILSNPAGYFGYPKSVQFATPSRDEIVSGVLATTTRFVGSLNSSCQKLRVKRILWIKDAGVQ